jgi:hypothetical protein
MPHSKITFNITSEDRMVEDLKKKHLQIGKQMLPTYDAFVYKFLFNKKFLSD